MCEVVKSEWCEDFNNLLKPATTRAREEIQWKKKSRDNRDLEHCLEIITIHYPGTELA